MAEGRKASKTGYEMWMEQEGIPIHEGYGIEDVTQVTRRPWSRTGGLGAFIQLKGLEGLTGMVVGEIPPGEALRPEKHLYEEIIYILKGIGSAEVWLDGKPKQRFEWAEGSLFAPPLNAWHRLYNGSREPVVFLALTNAPLLVDLFHNGEVLFSSDYVFPDRYLGQEKYFEVGEREDRGANHNWVWNTNFIPDVRSAPINAQERKGAGVQVTIFEMSQNTLVGHMTEWPVGRYHKAHYHLGGAVLVILKSKGYTLMWPRELGINPFKEGHGDKVVQVNWGVGSVFSPPTGWFHQHFNTGPVPARQLATRYGSINYRVGIWDALEGAGVMISVKKGGTLIEYQDQDPEINSRYEDALRREGTTSQMPPLGAR